MILRSLRLENFTVFPKARFDFAPGLNVIAGENGSGKTHILKLAYSAISALATQSAPSKQHLQFSLANKLSGVFRPDALGRLVQRRQGRLKCQVVCRFEAPGHALEYGFSRLAKNEVKVTKSSFPNGPIPRPVYLPTRELLTIYPGFVSLYETSHLPFEETWRDACILLGAPLARGPREQTIRRLLAPLEAAMGGKIELDKSGRFYLNTESSGRMEMHLVAEGLRKLATIARLIATGALLETGYLFWDEPEANLNPKLIKTAARTILDVAQAGIQVFIATHSLFLMREIEILAQSPEFASIGRHCIGLHLERPGSVRIEQGATLDDIGPIAALDEELSQSDRYLDSQAPGEK